jgi:hypothetical protein
MAERAPVCRARERRGCPLAVLQPNHRAQYRQENAPGSPSAANRCRLGRSAHRLQLHFLGQDRQTSDRRSDRSRARDCAPPHPLAAPGQPQAIANTAVILASDKASYMTGANVVVDGVWLVSRRAENCRRRSAGASGCGACRIVIATCRVPDGGRAVCCAKSSFVTEDLYGGKPRRA